MSDTAQLWLQDAEITHTAGKSLSNTLYKLPVTILLSGELGAGKTTFLQGLAQSLGIEALTSPTYALEQRYKTSKGWEFMHLDLYRLDERQARALLQGSEGHTGVRCIEWAERIPEFEDEPVIRVLLQDKHPKEGRMLSISFEDMRIPLRSEIEQWRKEVMLPANIGEHCDAVADFACALAETVMERGIVVRTNALRRSAEVHDLLRFVDFRPGTGHFHWEPSKEHEQTWEQFRTKFRGMKHEPACGALLREKGYPGIADIVTVHGLTLPAPDRVTIEQQLLYYADKRMMEDTTVSLEERFEDLQKRYGNGERSRDGDIWLAEAKAIEKKLFPAGVPL